MTEVKGGNPGNSPNAAPVCICSCHWNEDFNMYFLGQLHDTCACGCMPLMEEMNRMTTYEVLFL